MFSAVHRGLGALLATATCLRTPILILLTKGPTAGLDLSQLPNKSPSTAENFLMEFGVKFERLIKYEETSPDTHLYQGLPITSPYLMMS